jgi:hypothetical protein
VRAAFSFGTTSAGIDIRVASDPVGLPTKGVIDAGRRRDRLLTLDDTVEFLNLVLGLKLLAKKTRTWWHSFVRCEISGWASSKRGGVLAASSRRESETVPDRSVS